jgi:hypothetical protein
MSEQLKVFQAELDRLEAEDRWDDPGYDFLAAKVEELKAAERSKPSAPRAPAAAESEADALAKLTADMEKAAANMDAVTDEQAADLVARFNAMASAGLSQSEAVDLAALQRDMTIAGADANALTDEQRTELMGRFNRAARQQPVARPDSQDLGERMLAALQAHERGEDVPDELVHRLTGEEFMAWQQQRLEAARDPANLPPEIQDAAKVLYQAEAEMHRPADPVDAALGDLRAYVQSMRPPSVAEQLEALGVEPEPEPAQVSTGAGHG